MAKFYDREFKSVGFYFGVKKIPMKFVKFLLHGFKVHVMCAKL
jgi:hypothetical protein